MSLTPKDPLCPLGFHPQTRWPTRCKRCFREYKEHSSKKLDNEKKSNSLEVKKKGLYESKSFDEDAAKRASEDASRDFSTPFSSISSEAQARLNRLRENSLERKAATTDNLPYNPDGSGTRVRRRTTDLSNVIEGAQVRPSRRSLANDSNQDTSTAAPSSSMPTPPERRKFSAQVQESVTLRLSKSVSLSDYDSDRSSSVSPVPPRSYRTPSIEITEQPDASNSSSSSFKLRLPPSIKVSGSSDEGEPAASPKPKKTVKKKRLLIQEVKEVAPPPSSSDETDGSAENADPQSADVAFIIQVKSTRKKKKDEDDETMSMTTTTDTTETTLVDATELNQLSNGNEFSSWEYEELKKETDRLREKCDKLEKDKAEVLSRRVASLDAPKSQSSEFLKLQQKVNQLTCANEDLKDEQKHFEAKIRELEKDLGSRPSTEITQRQIAELRSKLTTAEAQIDHLHEEKREAFQQMKEMREEFEEMQDNFREEQAEEFSSLKKELDEASKNCRLLQFKLRKVEKRADQLEAEKTELEAKADSAKNIEKIAKLEEELAKTKSEYEKLQKDGGATNSRFKGSLSPTNMKKKSPVLTKAPSGEAVEPPVASNVDSNQLLRDLQSTLEREGDMREQLKFAEEEVMSMRKKISRMEDENESLSIQIKKISTKPKMDSKTGKVIESSSDKMDASELKLQLDVNEQESKILRRKIEEMETSNARLTKELQITQDKLHSLEKGNTSVLKSKSVDEVSVLRRKIIEKERDIERLETELLAVASKNKGKISRGKSADGEESKKLEELKLELKKAQTELSKTKTEAEAQKQSLEEKLAKARTDCDENRQKVTQLAEMNRNLVAQMEKFKQDMLVMKDQYEAIQDEFVIKNSQLAGAKEEMDSAYRKLKQEYETISKELKALRETFNTRQDTWIKEKLAYQEKMKEMDELRRKAAAVPTDKDSLHYKRLLEEKSLELDSRNQEMGSYKDQIIFMQKESDELRRKLDDYEKVSQVQMRSLSLASEPYSRSDKELKLLREKMLVEEKSHRNEIGQIKLRHDQQLALKTEEISSLQAQVSRAKRERDTFRQMVDSAQRAISELKSKNNANSRENISGFEEAATGARAAVNSLQERIQALEDELSQARRETSRAHTELATEKSSWEMQLGELQQKINEFEEDRLLSTGRTRAAGQRTRLELAWQKEREEQQRRLKEATTLARDLKNTMQEFERERERERAESKRRIEQLRVSIEEDQEELRRKIGDYQSDLLELRDAHAKLRTANEKLRKDREKLERERDAQVKRELDIRKIHSEREKMLDHLISTLTASPIVTSGGNSSEVLKYLQGMKNLKEPDDNFKDARRSNFRRAASAGGQEDRQSQESLNSNTSSYYGREHYGKYQRNPTSTSTLTLPSRGRTPTPGSGPSPAKDNSYNPRASLNKKSLSLEQTVDMPDERKIWRGNSDAGSASSIPSMDEQLSRGSSIDRMSTTSTKSEKPNSKGLVGKMKKLVKSRSIEDSPTASKVIQAGVQVAGLVSGAGSNSSLNYESDREKEPGKKLKDKVKGIFKRSSRSPSVERGRAAVPTPTPPPRSSRESTPKKDTHISTQRPLMPTESQQRPLMPSSKSNAPKKKL